MAACGLVLGSRAPWRAVGLEATAQQASHARWSQRDNDERLRLAFLPQLQDILRRRAHGSQMIVDSLCERYTLGGRAGALPESQSAFKVHQVMFAFMHRLPAQPGQSTLCRCGVGIGAGPLPLLVFHAREHA